MLILEIGAEFYEKCDAIWQQSFLLSSVPCSLLKKHPLSKTGEVQVIDGGHRLNIEPSNISFFGEKSFVVKLRHK